MPNYENILSPITLVGYGRSGTSLMSRVFNHHSAVEELGETANAIFTPSHALSEIKGLTRFNDAAAKTAAADITRYVFLRLYPSQKAEWMHKPIGLPKVFHAYFGYEKVDEFADWYWDTFYTVFPDSRTFTIVRHPYDVYISAKRYWGFTDNEIWNSQVAQMTLLAAPAAKLRVSLRYEQLVSAPEETLRQLCDKLSLPFHDTMMRPFAKLHAPNIGRWYGAPKEYAERQQAGFSHTSEWGDEIPESALAEEALSRYQKLLFSLGIAD